MSNNNTIAIAIAALLVGGVATAGYLNSRTPAIAAVDGARPDTLANADAPAAGAHGRGPALEFADVMDVRPVTRREPLLATVIGSEPVRESSTSSTPRQACNDVVMQQRLPERDGNVGGTVVGAVVGGLVGNQVGGGNGRKLATVAGAVGGGYVGREVDRRHVGGRVVDKVERRCRTVSDTSTTSRTVAWNVRYRNPDGSVGSVQTASKPGATIEVASAERTLGYDVTYSLGGQRGTVRMDHDPGAQLAVLDGEVVTRTASVAGAPLR